jgi:hypothetical protein
MRKLLVAPTFILAINDATENYVRKQAVFLVTISFSFGSALGRPLTPRLIIPPRAHCNIESDDLLNRSCRCVQAGL